jgi:hypothetical protein
MNKHIPTLRMSFDLFPCHETVSSLHALRAYKLRHSSTLSILYNITLLSFSFQKKKVYQGNVDGWRVKRSSQQ